MIVKSSSIAPKESSETLNKNPWSSLVHLREVRLVFKDTSMALKEGRSPSSIIAPSLSKMVAHGNGAIILAQKLPGRERPLSIEHTYQEGLAVKISSEEDGCLYTCLDESIILTPLHQHEGVVYEAAELRVDQSSESKDGEAVKALRAKVKELTNHAVAADPALGEAVLQMLGQGGKPEDMWVIVAAWFGHVAKGEMVPPGQMWCVD